MGIISRFINVVRAYSNSFLDKAEDPEKMLQQMLSDLEGQKRQAKQQMTEALALQKRLERDTEKEHKEAEKWEQKAILAVQNDKDDLAKEALVRKKDHERRAEEFEIQLEKHRANAETLRSGYQAMEDKIEEIKRKKGLLLAKQKQAEAIGPSVTFGFSDRVSERFSASEALQRPRDCRAFGISIEV